MLQCSYIYIQPVTHRVIHVAMTQATHTSPITRLILINLRDRKDDDSILHGLQNYHINIKINILILFYTLYVLDILFE